MGSRTFPIALLGASSLILMVGHARPAGTGPMAGLSGVPGWTSESNQAGAGFGAALSTAGDVNGDGFSDVIVGAPSHDGGEVDEGGAFVYLGSEAGLGTGASWSIESDQAGAGFGAAVALAGDVNGDGYSDVIVGASGWDGGDTDEGRAYVYHGSALGLATVPAWTAESNQAGAWFGTSVACAGDVNGDGYSDVIVGAPSFDGTFVDEGAAFVYCGSALGLAASPTFVLGSGQVGAWFGGAVSSAGDIDQDGFDEVLVGARAFDAGQIDEGKAFAYRGSASGLSTVPFWTMESDQAFASFGHSVATVGDLNGEGYAGVVIGAPLFDNGETDEGRAFVFQAGAAGLPTVALWTVESDQDFARFGESVSSAGDVNADGRSDLVIGAGGYDGGESDEGRAFLYHGTRHLGLLRAGWVEEADQALASFGQAVALAGDVDGDGRTDVLVGAPGFEAGEQDEGRAFLVGGAGTVPAALPNRKNIEPVGETDTDFGWSVAVAGDVNADGPSDVIVGAPSWGSSGSAFVYHGVNQGTTTLLEWEEWLVPPSGVSQYGICVASAGDVDGDGFAEVIVGANGWAFVHRGSPQGTDGSPAARWSVQSDQAGTLFGNSVASAGDVNGDGHADVLVGARLYDAGQTNEGRAYLYLGSRTGLASVPAWTFESNQAFAELGSVVASAGDVNADGFSDVLVAAPFFDGGLTNEGRCYVFHGSPGGLSSAPDLVLESDFENARLGASLASAGDVNGDGYSDVILGASRLSNPESFEGRVQLHLGSASGLQAVPAWSLESDETNAGLGVQVASGGDVNGDGFSDVLVVHDGHVGSWVQRALLYLGSAGALATEPAWTSQQIPGEYVHARSAAGGGDVNGDGYADILLGHPDHDEDLDFAFEGAFFTFFGSGEVARTVRAVQQRDASGERSISVLGKTDAFGSFRIRVELLRSPAGFRWASPVDPEAWLEWEVRALDQPFDDSVVQRGAPQLLQPGAGTLVFEELALAAPSVGHARSTRAQAFRWRARIATSHPLFPCTPWFSAPGNALTEEKLHKPALRLR